MSTLNKHLLSTLNKHLLSTLTKHHLLSTLTKHRLLSTFQVLPISMGRRRSDAISLPNGTQLKIQDENLRSVDGGAISNDAQSVTGPPWTLDGSERGPENAPTTDHPVMPVPGDYSFHPRFREPVDNAHECSLGSANSTFRPPSNVAEPRGEGLSFHRKRPMTDDPQDQAKDQAKVFKRRLE